MARPLFGSSTRHRPMPSRLLHIGCLLLAVVGLNAPAFAVEPAQRPPAATSAADGVVPSVTDCTTAALGDFSDVPGAPTRLLSATVTSLPQPDGTSADYCVIRGSSPPALEFELKLPVDTWRGRFLQTGCGGLCGAIPATQAPKCDAAPSDGFAVGAENSGHTAGPIDASWAGTSQEVRDQYGFSSPHIFAVAAKAVMKKFYGSEPHHSYFDGCSGGGRQAAALAQRYPDDFDGIIAGAPSVMQAEGLLAGVWLIRAGSRADGSLILTNEVLATLHQAVMAACDGEDGLIDGQLDDPRQCGFDPGTIRCTEGQTTDCLTEEQVTAARLAYQPAQTAEGKLLYPGGAPYGSELSWPLMMDYGRPTATEYLKWAVFPLDQTPSPYTAYNWPFTLEHFKKLKYAASYLSPSSPDLSAFRKSGGKLILWHGWADGFLPPTGTTSYYKTVVDRMGGLSATQRFARLFMVPGVYHCAGGYQAYQTDFLSSMVRWVENGEAPQQITAVRPADGDMPERTRPVFPYPTVARYDGSGSIEDASNFVPGKPVYRVDDDVKWVGPLNR